MKLLNTNVWNRLRYSFWAPIYDRIASLPEHRRRSIEVLAPRPGEDVLILGAGTGADLPYIPEGVRLTAVDITPAMIERLRRRAAALGRQVDARVMDGQALALPDGRFDAVVLHLILAVIPDPVACIREAARVLKPGGRAVVWDKFIPDQEEPTMGRRLANVAAATLFSDITRRLGPLVASAGLMIEHEKATTLGGLQFKTVLLRKRA